MTSSCLAESAPSQPVTTKPVASKVVITGSGFSSAEKEVLKEWVQQLGAQYSGALVCGLSTHLVSRNLMDQFGTQKYYKAVHWGIAIVSFRWVYDSLKAGKLLPLSRYKSDEPGPADVALREAALRRAQQTQQQRQAAERPPLRILCPNVADEHAGLCHRLKVQLSLEEEKPGDAANQKKRPAGLRDQNANEDDFTFDVPCEGSAAVTSPRLCGTAGTSRPTIGMGCRAGNATTPVAAPHLGVAQQVERSAPGGPSSGDSTPADAAEAQFQEPSAGPGHEQQPLQDSFATPSIDISLTQLEGTILVGGVTADPTAPDGPAADDSTPTSGVSFDGFYVTQRSAAVRPTRLVLGGEEPTRAAGAAAATVSPSAAVAASPECIDLLSPCAATPPAAGPFAAAALAAPPAFALAAQTCPAAPGTEVGPPPATLQPPPPPASSAVLYSGFDLPLAAIATATKGRRLVRNDRLLKPSDPDGGRAAAGRRDEELEDSDADPSFAHLEDDLEDDVEDPVVLPASAPAPAPLAATAREASVRQGMAMKVAAGKPQATGSVMAAVRALEDTAKQGNCNKHGPMPPATTAQSSCTAASTSVVQGAGATSAGQPHQQPQHQQPPMPVPQRAPLQQQQQQQQRQPASLREVPAEVSHPPPQRASAQDAVPATTMRIKADPGVEEEGGQRLGPVGPVLEPEPSVSGSYSAETAATRQQQACKKRTQMASRAEYVPNSSSLAANAATKAGAAAAAPPPPPHGAFAGVSIKREQDAADGDAAAHPHPLAAAPRPSARRRAAALATSSLVSEPAPIAPRPGSGANAAAARGRGNQPQAAQRSTGAEAAAAADAGAGLEDTDDTDGGGGGGYTSATSAGDIPTDLTDDAVEGDAVGGRVHTWAGAGGAGAEGTGGAGKWDETPLHSEWDGHDDGDVDHDGDECPTPKNVRAVGLCEPSRGVAPRGGSQAGPATINRILSIRTGGLTPLPPSQRQAIMPGAMSDISSEPDNDSPAASVAAAAAHTAKARAPARSRLAVGSRPAVRKPALAPPQTHGAGGGDGDTTVTASSDSGGDDTDGDQDEDFAPARRKATATAITASKRPAARALPAPTASQSQSQSISMSVSTSTSASLMRQGSGPGPGEGQCQWQPPLTEERSISKYLREAVRMSEEHLRAAALAAGASDGGGGGGAVELLHDGDVRMEAPMKRAPRSNTVRQRHPGVALKAVEFAEQVMVGPLKLLLNCRDRSRRARCPIIALPGSAANVADGDGDGTEAAREVFLAEPCVLYRLPSGEWWLEYYRFYSKSDLAAFATATGRPVTVPRDFEGRRELMRDTDRSHCRLIHVRGDLGVMRTKKHPPASTTGRPGGRPAFCRYVFDTHTGEALTDQAGKDFVIDA